jgi:large subunit ribosomal protein L41
MTLIFLTLPQRYPGYWIDGKFHYIKEMEPELIVPDLTDFPLKPYVSYRANELETPELTAKALFNLVYADDIYKQYLKGEDVEGEEMTTEEMIEQAEQARAEAEKTGSDRFVPDSWYGIGVDKFD